MRSSGSHPAGPKRAHKRAWSGKPGGPRKDEHRRPHRGGGGPARPLGEGEGVRHGWGRATAGLGKARRRVRKFCATENGARRLAEDGLAPALEPEIVRPDAIARQLPPDAVHNGLLAQADPLPAPELEELEPAGIVLVLDQITDPHNVGA